MKLLLTAALALLAAGSASDAQIITLFPTSDVFLSAANPTLNFGGSGGLAVAASGLPKGEFTSLLQFDLATAKSSFDALYGAGAWSLASLTLTLTANPPNNAIFNGSGSGPGGTNVNTAGSFSLEWLAADTWIEGTGIPQTPGATGMTFASLPTLLGSADETLGTFVFPGGNTGSAAHHLALTPGFAADAASGGLVTLLARPADASVAMVVSSRTGGLNARPILTVVAVPEPTTAALAVGGLLLLARRRRTA